MGVIFGVKVKCYGFGEDRKYYFEGFDGEIYGEEYDEAYDFSEGFAVVRKDGKWYYVDDKDFKRHGEGYDMVHAFSEGFAAVKKDGKWYFVDKQFKLHGEEYDDAFHFRKGFAAVKKDGKWYFVDKQFKLHGEGYDAVKDILYYRFSEGFVVVKKDDKLYYVDNKDFKLHGEGYDDADYFRGGFAEVKKGEQVYTINENFERIKRNNQIMEDVDYLQEAKDDVKSIVGIPSSMFSDEFVAVLKEVVYKYFFLKIDSIVDHEANFVREIEFIKATINDKQKKYKKQLQEGSIQESERDKEWLRQDLENYKESRQRKETQIEAVKKRLKNELLSDENDNGKDE